MIRGNARPISAGERSQRPVDPSISVNGNLTVPHQAPPPHDKKSWRIGDSRLRWRWWCGVLVIQSTAQDGRDPEITVRRCALSVHRRLTGLRLAQSRGSSDGGLEGWMRPADQQGARHRGEWRLRWPRWCPPVVGGGAGNRGSPGRVRRRGWCEHRGRTRVDRRPLDGGGGRHIAGLLHRVHRCDGGR